MKKFQYQIVKYIHDIVTAEFVNVGIIVYQPETNFLRCRFVSNLNRVSNFFKNVNEQQLFSAFEQFENEIKIESTKLNELIHTSLIEITNSILPKDDSSLVCSELYFGIDISPTSAFEDLFNRLIKQ